MKKDTASLLTVIVPTFNEESNVQPLYDSLMPVLKSIDLPYELIFVNDGSTDGTSQALWGIADRNNAVRVIEFSRNFGKEIALSAGINAATGDAAIMVDADLQFPVTLLPEFVAKWQAGAEVVIGVRRSYQHEPMQKKLASWFFYKLLNAVADVPITPHATDFRLIDRVVMDAFNRFSERNRMTRGLIDWLGFERAYITFDIGPRLSGPATYGFRKLLRLAMHSFVGLSLFPLRLAGYFGIFITAISSLLGIFILVEKIMLHDPWHLRISGTAQLSDINLILIGIVLMSLGLVALYIANIHEEVINRPLYVVRSRQAKR